MSSISLKDLESRIANEEVDRLYVERLNKNVDKVIYLRNIKKYTQEKAADIIGISTRQLQRIEKTLRENKKMSC